MHIKTENQTVRRQLEFIANSVIECGGIIHPRLVITHNAEKLWISCPAQADGDILLMVPDELFIPVTDLEWTSVNSSLSYSGDTSKLSTLQKDILDAMVALYNATDKIKHVAECFPVRQFSKDPKLLDWLIDARPDFILPNANPARLFIETRICEKPSKSDEQSNSIGYLMPLIDLLNHHPYGPKYQRTEQGDWLIVIKKNNLDSDECFVRYGKSDSLYLAIWHTYFEPNTRYLASLDCTIQHISLGTVRIKGTHVNRRKINAPRILTEEHNLTLQDIVLEQEKLPALRTLLGLAVRSKRRELTQLQAEIIADELIVLLVEANQNKYSELLALCQNDKGEYPLRILFGQVANHQLSILANLKNK